MERNLFRDEAVKQLTSPEQLDQRMKLARRREWFAMGAALLVLISVLGWAWMGSVETRASGPGMILRDGGVIQMTADYAGAGIEFQVNPGDIVEPDAPMATFYKDNEDLTTVTNYYGERVRVLELLVDYDQFFSPGYTIMLLEFVDRPLGTLAYLGSVSGTQIDPGMRVRVVLSSYPEQQYGYIEGTVVSVGPFPATTQRMNAVIGDDALVQSVQSLAGTSPTEIIIQLETDESTPSGFKWSSSQGPDIQLTSGLMAEVEIVIEEQRPISLVFP